MEIRLALAEVRQPWSLSTGVHETVTGRQAAESQPDEVCISGSRRLVTLQIKKK